MVRLGEVSEFIGGFAFKSSELKKEKPSNEYLPVIKISNFDKAGCLNLENIEFHLYQKGLSKFKIRIDDVLVAMTGATVGKTAISHLENLLLNQRVGLIRAKRNVTLQKFLKSLLFSKNFYKYCQKTAGGGAQGNISPTQIMEYKIPLPPLSTQHRLVEILEEADNLRNLRKQADEKMQNLIPSLFVDMFGDPVSNTKGWGMVGLGEVLKRKVSQVLPSEYPDKEFFYIGLEHIESNTGRLSKINFELGKKILSNKNSFETEDILYGKLRPYLNKVLLADRNGICSTDIWVLQTDKKFADTHFVSAFLKFPKTVKTLNSVTEGINLPRVNAGKFDKLQIPLPPLPLQQEFAARVEEIEAEKARQTESRKKLDELFNSLMQRAFTGKLVA